MTETKRILDADVYDTLELAAEAFGGVGCGSTWEIRGKINTNAPCCIHGLAAFAENLPPDRLFPDSVIKDALWRAKIGGPENDAVFANVEVRIPFAEWCKRLHVERGSDV